MTDRLVFGMHHLNITQIGSLYDGKTHLSHASYELDLAGEDSGIDYWYNKMPNTYWKIAGRFGSKSTGNTYFFWSCDATGKAIPVRWADGTDRVTTLAMTHSNADYKLGKIIAPGEIMYQEGTAGHASGNHIHLEIAEGCVNRKIQNAKGYYNIVNIVDARRVMWILDGYTTVVNTKGLNFKHCDKVPVEEEDVIYIRAKRSALNIRQGLEFNAFKTNTTKVLKTIPKGERAKVTHFTQRFEKDGFEWCQVEYDGVSGFCQMDMQYYLLERE